jgi:hypothetical protein
LDIEICPKCQTLAPLLPDAHDGRVAIDDLASKPKGVSKVRLWSGAGTRTWGFNCGFLLGAGIGIFSLIFTVLKGPPELIIPVIGGAGCLAIFVGFFFALATPAVAWALGNLAYWLHPEARGVRQKLSAKQSDDADGDAQEAASGNSQFLDLTRLPHEDSTGIRAEGDTSITPEEETQG